MPRILRGYELLDTLNRLGGHQAGNIEGTSMPKLIHQTWKTADIPGLYGELRQTWLTTYPGWTHVLWTDEDNAALMRQLYHQYLHLYTAFPAEIYRVDVARYLYMHAFGGIYADLDFDAYKSIEPLLANNLRGAEQAVVLSHMEQPVPSNENNELNSMPNAFMASTPGHPFWLEVMARIKKAWEDDVDVQADGKGPGRQVEYITGPVVLRQAYQEWLKSQYNRYDDLSFSDPSIAARRGTILLLPPAFIYPFAWYGTARIPDEDKPATLGDDVAFDLPAMRARFNNGEAYACTYWGESWRRHGWKPEREGYVQMNTIQHSA